MSAVWLPQLTMAIWLTVTATVFGRFALRKDGVTLRLTVTQVRRIGLLGVAGAIGEALTLGMGGFWL